MRMPLRLPIPPASIWLGRAGSSQPPPRRRYGRPNYSSGNTNADGSEKYTFLAGIGYAGPTGNTHKYETPSYGFQFGGGRNFSKVYGLLAQFDYDHFGLQGATIANQQYIYNYCTAADESAGYCYPVGPNNAQSVSGLDGNNHVWSFTLNPTFTLPTEGSLGAYAVFGVGFYHKVTNFTEPTLEEYCYYYCEEIRGKREHRPLHKQCTSGSMADSASPINSPSSPTSGSIRKLGTSTFPTRSAMASPHRTFATSPLLTATDFYPANSNRTTYIPVKFGIRF